MCTIEQNMDLKEMYRWLGDERKLQLHDAACILAALAVDGAVVLLDGWRISKEKKDRQGQDQYRAVHICPQAGTELT